MAEAIILFAATAALLYLSRASLRLPGSHGFYRFFAWESILLLLLLNARFWFLRPFAWHQIISWLLLLVSLLLLVPGVNRLRREGKPDTQRADPALLGIEKTTVLVTSGIYRYIRHPLYSSLLFLGWGIYFKHFSLLATLLILVATVFLCLTARAEEEENARYFGAAYHDYRQRSKMFVPFLF